MDITILVKVEHDQDVGSLSLDVGDNIYWADYTTDRSIEIVTGNPNLVGVVKSLTILPTETVDDVVLPSRLRIICILDSTYGSEPTSTAFILFQKSRGVNVSEVKGYYGEAKFVNNSSSKCELFTASCEISESSK